MFRPALLARRVIVLAGDVPDELALMLCELGASIRAFPEIDDDERAAGWIRENPSIHALVVNVATGFDPDDAESLNAALERGWSQIRPIASEAMIRSADGGKIVLLAPPAGVGRYAPALRAATENLARTLSVEWARHAITVTAVAPGPQTRQQEVAAVVVYLLSHAGDYFSGCAVELVR